MWRVSNCQQCQQCKQCKYYKQYQQCHQCLVLCYPSLMVFFSSFAINMNKKILTILHIYCDNFAKAINKDPFDKWQIKTIQEVLKDGLIFVTLQGMLGFGWEHFALTLVSNTFQFLAENMYLIVPCKSLPKCCSENNDRQSKPWQISCSMKWRSQQNDGKKEEEKNEWRSQNQMLEEQKMLISVLVVCLTIEFGSMR